MKCYYFGTFNPPHKGHIKTANDVIKEFGFSSCVFVPAYLPPHKNLLLSPIHRFNMLKLLENDKIKVSDIEFNLPKPSYSFQTVNELYKENKKRVNMIIGFDAFINIEKWKNPEILKEKVHFIVLKRKGEKQEDIEKLANKGFDFEICENIGMVDVSSTEIREKAASGADISDLVDKKVQRYINENKLYR